MKRHYRFTGPLSVAAISAMSLAGASAAFADAGIAHETRETAVQEVATNDLPATIPDGPADEIAAAVSEAAPHVISATALTTSPTEATATFEGGGEAVLAIDPIEGVRINASDGIDSMSFSLPGAGKLGEAAVADDGSLTYVGNATTPSVNLIASDELIRVSVVIDDASQPERFDYDFGAGATVEIQNDGSAVVYVVESSTDPATGGTAPTEKIIANVDAPWAKDANGIDIRTHYEASESRLTQVVDHQDGNYAYPIVADPTLDRPNVFQYRLRFNRAETATIASGGAGVIASVGCGVMAPVCVVAGGSVWWNASVAQNSNPKRCVQITATQPYIYPGVLWWVDTYSGGPCR